jgi:membrane protease YdiL (CAAX protease family)
MSSASSDANHTDAVADQPPTPDVARGVTWGPLSAIVVTLFAYVGALAVGGLLLTGYVQLRGWSHGQIDDWRQTIGAQFAYVAITEAIIMSILWLFLRWRRASIRSLGFRKPPWRELGVIGVWVLIYFGLYIVTAIVSRALLRVDTSQQQDVGFQDVVGAGPLILTFVSLVVLPPLVEESIFRGFLYGGLRARWGVLAATLVTSLLFALPHIAESGDGTPLWIAGIDTFVLSCVLCHVREKTGRLWASIGIHALKNGLAFFLLFILHVR